MLNRKATYFSPALTLTGDSLHIAGRLWMENPQSYFEDVFIYTKKSNAGQFSVRLDVEHLNSSSIKQLLIYFILLKELTDKGNFSFVHIVWNIPEDDNELKEVILDLAQVSEINIEIHTYNSEKSSL
ncbi:MAG: SiaC family regulatory phosphoprotein [Bacteroidota bacterium]|nr:SiaC family regulatory phosphoprotein [Bacteroidota bacterium]